MGVFIMGQLQAVLNRGREAEKLLERYPNHPNRRELERYVEDGKKAHRQMEKSRGYRVPRNKPAAARAPEDPRFRVAKMLGAEKLLIVKPREGGSRHDGASLVQDLRTESCVEVPSWLKEIGELSGRFAVSSGDTIVLYQDNELIGEYDLQGRKTYDPPEDKTYIGD